MRDMKQTDPQFKLRLPQDLKSRLESAASDNRRSVTAEIVARLEESFASDMTSFIRTKIAPLENGSALEIEDVKLNLQIVLEQLDRIQKVQAAKRGTNGTKE